MKYKRFFVMLLVLNIFYIFAQQRIVFLDPGHGGKDPGAKGEYTRNGETLTVYEKDIVLHLSKKIHDRLKTIAPDIGVVLSRNDDSFVSLEERDAKAATAIGNKNGLYISIHNDVSLSKTSNGFSLQVNTKNRSFAHALSNELEKITSTQMANRGVTDITEYKHQRKKNADIILNLGFISNDHDVRLLADNNFLDACAACIADCIKEK